MSVADLPETGPQPELARALLCAMQLRRGTVAQGGDRRAGDRSPLWRFKVHGARAGLPVPCDRAGATVPPSTVILER
jgi:hypothetical protein